MQDDEFNKRLSTVVEQVLQKHRRAQHVTIRALFTFIVAALSILFLSILFLTAIILGLVVFIREMWSRL